MIKKSTSGVLSRSVSSRTGVRSGLPAIALAKAGDFAPSGWGSVRGVHGVARVGLAVCRQGARRRRCGTSSTTSDAVYTWQPPCARRVPGGVGQLRRCFSLTMEEHRLQRSALHLTPRHQERNPVYSSDRPQLEAFLIILLFSLIPLVFEIPALQRLENSFSAAC
jgi:hypothetical protein